MSLGPRISNIGSYKTGCLHTPIYKRGMWDFLEVKLEFWKMTPIGGSHSIPISSLSLVVDILQLLGGRGWGHALNASWRAKNRILGSEATFGVMLLDRHSILALCAAGVVQSAGWNSVRMLRYCGHNFLVRY